MNMLIWGEITNRENTLLISITNSGVCKTTLDFARGTTELIERYYTYGCGLLK